MVNTIIQRIKKVLKGSFLKNVSVLMTGTAIAQVLAFAASPILSRLYDPNAFGVFGLFTAVSGIIAVVACGKYELAIMLPNRDKDAANILILSIVVILTVTAISLCLMMIFRESLAYWLGSPELAVLLWWIPASVLCAGLYKAFNYWTTRRKEFQRLSISRVIQTGGREGSQLGLGFFTSFQAIGLVFGHVFGQLSSAVSLIAQTYKEDFTLIKKSISKTRMRYLAYKHKDFPKYTAPQVLLNSISQNVPAMLLASFFNPGVVGFYWFTQRILGAPSKLIGNSVRQVYYQRANELLNEGKNVLNLFLKTTGGLALFGLVPLITLVLLGPPLFDFIFGNEWFEAGRYSQWLSLWWFAAFINTPSVMMIPIMGLQKFQLYFEVVVTVSRVLAIVTGGMAESAILAVALFALVGFVANMYLIIHVFNKIYKKEE